MTMSETSDKSSTSRALKDNFVNPSTVLSDASQVSYFTEKSEYLQVMDLCQCCPNEIPTNTVNAVVMKL